MALGSTGPVETKVTVSSVSAAVTSFVMAWLLTHWGWLASVNDALAVLILAAVTYVVTLGAGFIAKHTPRTDSDARK